MVSKKANLLWPTLAKSPMGKVQAMLVPVTDEIYSGGASVVILKVWADDRANPVHCTFTYSVEYTRRNKSSRNEYRVLVERLRSLGCRVEAEGAGDVSGHRIYVLVKLPLKNIESAHVVGTLSQDYGKLSQNGDISEIETEQHDLANGRLSIKKLKNDYELHSLSSPKT